MNINIHPWARADLKQRIEYLRDHDASDQVLADLQVAIKETLEKISANPQTWSLASGSTKIRKVQILQFRMQAFYGIPNSGIPIVIEFAGPGVQPRWPRRLRRADPMI